MFDSFKKGLAKLKESLTKTREEFVGRLQGLFKKHLEFDEDFWEEMEEILITADMGSLNSADFIETLQQNLKDKKVTRMDQFTAFLKSELEKLLQSAPMEKAEKGKLLVILVVGVNGSGKTTSIAKLAYRYKKAGRKVLLAAGDTYRAAAIDQLEIWGERTAVDVIKHQEGADSAAVVFDALQAAKARQTEVLIIDTAGRLQTKINLMEELKKIKRILNREVPDAKCESLLVIDSTNGQNAISQAKIFGQAVDVTGIILTKMDGTAKGGFIFSIAKDLGIPIKLIGVGEKMQDLKDFDAKLFVDALFSEN